MQTELGSVIPTHHDFRNLGVAHAVEVDPSSTELDRNYFESFELPAVAADRLDKPEPLLERDHGEEAEHDVTAHPRRLGLDRELNDFLSLEAHPQEEDVGRTTNLVEGREDRDETTPVEMEDGGGRRTGDGSRHFMEEHTQELRGEPKEEPKEEPQIIEERIERFGPESASSTSSTSSTSSRATKKMRKRKTYSKPIPSRYCHICSRVPKESSPHVTCANMLKGICRKTTCKRCFIEHGWDWGRASAPDARWLCTHCQDACPARAQCHIYTRTNRRRKSAIDICKQRAAAAAAAAAGAAARAAGPAQTPYGPRNSLVEKLVRSFPAMAARYEHVNREDLGYINIVPNFKAVKDSLNFSIRC